MKEADEIYYNIENIEMKYISQSNKNKKSNYMCVFIEDALIIFIPVIVFILILFLIYVFINY